MAKDGSVAPKERINIKYVPATGDQQEELELPLRLMVVGDFKGHTEEEALEDRKTVEINKTSFNSVMKEANISVSTSVKDCLSEGGDEDATLDVNLDFQSMSDFSPDTLVEKVPELKKMVELREALVALKGPIGNMKGFREQLQSLLNDAEKRQQLTNELDQVLSEKKSTSKKDDSDTSESK
jgi:type VI secretion system protein ImpB